MDDGAPSPSARPHPRNPPSKMPSSQDMSQMEETTGGGPARAPLVTRPRAAPTFFQAPGGSTAKPHEATAAKPSSQRFAPAARAAGPPASKGTLDPRLFDFAPPPDEDCPWEDGSPQVVTARRVFVSGDSGPLSAPVKRMLLPSDQCQRTAMYSMTPAQDSSLPPQQLGMVSCPICCETVGQASCVFFSCANHFCCNDCGRTHLLSKLAEGQLPKCLDNECGAEPPTEMPRMLLSDAELERYFLVKLRATQRVRNCPRCNTNVCIPTESSGSTSVPQSVRCPQCSIRFCADCGLTFYKDHDCDNAKRKLRMRQDVFADDAIKDLKVLMQLKSCPSCGEACEKGEAAACDHMTCAKCRHEFCWVCLRDRAVIYAHGNHYHDPACRHFREYDAEPDFLPTRCERCKRRGRACTPSRVVKKVNPPTKPRSFWTPWWQCG